MSDPSIPIPTIVADAELDLRGVICPYNFVKTKLKLETMELGQVLSVLLDDGDPIKNVPRSVSDDGHTVLSQERIQTVISRDDPEMSARLRMMPLHSSC